jgi:hypothetical protein
MKPNKSIIPQKKLTNQCPRCHGQLITESDATGRQKNCIQCGNVIYLERLHKTLADPSYLDAMADNRNNH